MLMLAQFVPFTYIAPLLGEVTGLAPQWIPLVLLLNGVGATVGVFLGGRLADWKLMPSLIALMAVQGVVLALMYLVSPNPFAMVAVVTVWGGINFAIGTPIQSRILAWTADAPNLASALIPSGFNLGIAIAASVGAAMLGSGLGYRDLPLVGVAAMVVGVAVGLISYGWEQSRGQRPPVRAG